MFTNCLDVTRKLTQLLIYIVYITFSKQWKQFRELANKEFYQLKIQK